MLVEMSPRALIPHPQWDTFVRDSLAIRHSHGPAGQVTQGMTRGESILRLSKVSSWKRIANQTMGCTIRSKSSGSEEQPSPLHE